MLDPDQVKRWTRYDSDGRSTKCNRSGIASVVIRTGEALNLSPDESTPIPGQTGSNSGTLEASGALPPGSRSSVCVPILNDAGPFGAIEVRVVDGSNVTRFSRDDEDVLKEYSELISSALKSRFPAACDF